MNTGRLLQEVEQKNIIIFPQYFLYEPRGTSPSAHILILL